MARHRESHDLGSFLSRMARALHRRAKAGDLDALVVLVETHKTLAVTIREAGADLHSYGYTYEDIGSALGVSRQAAEKRFGRGDV